MTNYFTVQTFTLAVCIAMCCSVVGSSYTRAAITTLERFFGLTTTELSLISSTNQLIAVISTPFLVGITREFHIPRTLWVSFLVCCVGFFTLTAPYFLAPKYVPVAPRPSNDTEDDSQLFCAASVDEHDETMASSSMKSWAIFLILGKAIIGFGGCVVWPHSITFIHNNSVPGQAPMLISILLTIILVGPIIAFIMGGSILKLWVNFPDPAPVEVDPKGSEWVGAWWLGYFIVTIFLAILSFPLRFFPRELAKNDQKAEYDGMTEYPDPEEKKKLDSKKDEKVNLEDDEFSAKQAERNAFARIWYDTKDILQNPLFVMQLIAGILSSWAMAAKVTFGQKYMEMQFNLSQGEASHMKIFYVLTLCLGFFMGGVFTKRWKMNPKSVMKFMLVNNLVYMLAPLGLWCLPGCTPQHPELIFGLETNQSLAAEDCLCTTDKFVPMCGRDFTFDGIHYENTTIISPCKAGCTSVDISDEIADDRNYTGCHETVERGICGGDDCGWRLTIYIAVICIGTFFSGLNGSPGTVFMMRCVKKEQKAFATALIGVGMKLLGWSIAPVLFGKLFQEQCVLESERGNCVLYDNANVRNFYYGILGICSLIYSTVCIYFYYLFCKRLKSGKPMWGGMNTEEPL